MIYRFYHLYLNLHQKQPETHQENFLFFFLGKIMVGERATDIVCSLWLQKHQQTLELEIWMYIVQ